MTTSKKHLPFAYHISIILLVYLVQLLCTTPRIMYASYMHYYQAMQFADEGVWHTFSKSFPLLEPAYAFFVYLVSLIAAGDALLKTVPAIQCLFILGIALMVFDLSRILIQERRTRLFILYAIAISPALMTSALTLYCEIFSAFCFAIAVYSAWKAMRNKNRLHRYGLGILSALSAGVTILAKSAFLYVIVASILSFSVYRLLATDHKKRLPLLGKLALYLGLTLLLPSIWTYRNDAVYGVKRLATRGALTLAGRFYHSQNHYNAKDWAIETITTVSEQLGWRLFGDQLNNYTWRRADRLGYEYLLKINNQYKIIDSDNYRTLSFDPHVDDIAWRELKKEILSSDFMTIFRFLAFGLFQLIGLIIFETICYDTLTVHANWLAAIYGFLPLRILVRIGLSLFYLTGVLICITAFTRKWKNLRLNQDRNDFLALCGFPIFWYFAVYSMSLVNMRYTFVIAPFYILIAFFGWSKTRLFSTNN